mmetsp:Transcript_13100/g.33009  ORF Transcript_13100/g.33009 Transcript_13100/m.33009 type:complete len:221 (-) Transcript_13100:762-1424(-)
MRDGSKQHTGFSSAMLGRYFKKKSEVKFMGSANTNLSSSWLFNAFQVRWNCTSGICRPCELVNSNVLTRLPVKALKPLPNADESSTSKKIGTKRWSCKFRPTSGECTEVRMPCEASFARSPIPDNINNCGDCRAPPHRTISLLADTARSGAHFKAVMTCSPEVPRLRFARPSRKRTPAARLLPRAVSSMSIRVTNDNAEIVRFLRWRTSSVRYATAVDCR